MCYGKRALYSTLSVHLDTLNTIDYLQQQKLNGLCVQRNESQLITTVVDKT